jgi:hypothetical protein
MRFFIVIFSFFLFLNLFTACQSSKQYIKAHSNSEAKRKKVYDDHLLVKNSILNPKKKKLKKNEPILCEDSVNIQLQEYHLESDLASHLYNELFGMLRQKPNRVLLYGRPFLWIYNISDTCRVKYRYEKNYTWEKRDGEWIHGAIRPDTINIKKRIGDSTILKKGKFRKFIMTKIGEPPVLFDITKTRLTARSMQNHLIQKGFLDAKVGYKINFKKHKAMVEYYYTTGKPVLIDTVIFESEDLAMKKIMEELKSGTELKKGMPMDKTAFLKERTRLTSEIRNRGYYNFNWNYITYIADTANSPKIAAAENSNIIDNLFSSKLGEQGESRVQIYVNIISPSDTVESHTKYTLKDVFVVLDEPKVEIHKIKRKFLMDTTYVVLRPPRKKLEISHMYKSSVTELDSTVYLKLQANEGRNIIEELSKEKSRSLAVVAGAKFPYWISMRKIKNGRNNEVGLLEENDKNKITFIYTRNNSKSFFKSKIHTNFNVKNPNDSSFYNIILTPYKRRFVRSSYKNFSNIEENDIPIHIMLRKPAKSAETDSIKKVKEELKLKKDNFIIRDQVISQFVQISSGSTYNYDAGRETVNRISDLEIFRFPRVEYVPSKSGNTDELDAYVFMQKSKKQLFGADTDFNTTNANLGWALNLNYKNRNVFKGAEIFLFNIEGGINFDPTPENVSSTKGIIQWIDFLDVNSSLSLFFPKIIGFRNWSLSVEKPKSTASVSYHYLQQSTDFRVSSFDASFGYDWSLKNKKHAFIWNPFILNFTLEPVLDSEFENRLKQSNYALWASLKERYFLPGSNFSYLFKPKLPDKHQFQMRSFFEMTGNTAFLIDLVSSKDIEIFKTAYSQYVKADFDIRYTYKISKKHLLATRVMAGAAVPVGSTVRVPYSRQFFVGGPSSMRGWNMRELGPGKMRAQDGALFQLGDIRLEMNAEYRFMLNSWIGSCFFIDAGNVWFAKSYENQNTTVPFNLSENGVFNINFLEELGVDVGTGLRLDMSFFVLRVDFAVPIRNPAGFKRIDNNGFVHYTNASGFPIYWKFDWRSTNFLLAVGYPF